VHCKSFRRLKHKTQVFVAPEGDHYRTRLTHTLEVTAISRTVARALDLNEDLTEAIGLGHDLGHPPFGHIGEAALDDCLRERFGTEFRHYEHSLRVVERLERDGAGLNLTDDVRDGILCHSAARRCRARSRAGSCGSSTGSPTSTTTSTTRCAPGAHRGAPPADAPIAALGPTAARGSTGLVHDLVERSADAGDIVQGEEAGAAMDALRTRSCSTSLLGTGRPVARLPKVDRSSAPSSTTTSPTRRRLPDGGGVPDSDPPSAVTTTSPA
jgi:dGTPase